MSLLTALENMSDADLKKMVRFQALLDTDSVSSIKDDSGNLYPVAACESSKPGIKSARRIEELINNIQERMITERMITERMITERMMKMTIGASPSPKRETDNTELHFFFTEMPSGDNGGNEQSKLCGENEFLFHIGSPSQ